MLELLMNREEAKPLRVLAIGAHSDDIEIGCGGTLLRLIERGLVEELWWVVLTGSNQRRDEAQASAEALLEGVPHRILLGEFADGYFPYDGREIKEFVEGIKASFTPDQKIQYLVDLGIDRGDLDKAGRDKA